MIFLAAVNPITRKTRKSRNKPGQELGDRERRAGDRREAEQRREDADDQKYQGHVQHGSNPPVGVLRKACREGIR